ncbi:ATP synthase subunit I [Thiotrichales bacterium 19S3-7]|nr:ATP synthase subunit I [Thiotrichales bacterium 19S3-7]MCF6800920.1 ATP synthase subunit I [Thiotrichales bacterium 19S3-11]
MKRLQIKPFLLFQFALLVIGSLVAIVFSYQAFISFFLGAVILFVGNSLMLLRFFLKPVLMSASNEVLLLFLGEFLKLLVIAVGSVLVAMYIDVNFGVYLVGLILLQVAMWMMPLFIK